MEKGENEPSISPRNGTSLTLGPGCGCIILTSILKIWEGNYQSNLRSSKINRIIYKLVSLLVKFSEKMVYIKNNVGLNIAFYLI